MQNVLGRKQHSHALLSFTPWKTNISPETWWVENENSFENGPSSGDMLVFSGNVPHILTIEVSLPKPAPGFLGGKLSTSDGTSPSEKCCMNDGPRNLVGMKLGGLSIICQKWKHQASGSTKNWEKFQGAFPTLHPSNPRMEPKSTSIHHQVHRTSGNYQFETRQKPSIKKSENFRSQEFFGISKKNWACWCCLSCLLQFTMFYRDSCWRGRLFAPNALL